MTLGTKIKKLKELGFRKGIAVLRAIGLRGWKNMVLTAAKTSNEFLSIIFSKNTRVHIDPQADIKFGGQLVFGMKINELTEYWMGGSTLHIGPDAKFEISESNSVASIGPRSRVGVTGHFKMGSTSYIASEAHLTCQRKVSIGERCAIARGLNLRDSDVHEILIDGKIINEPEPVEIQDGVWIGSNVTIKKGVTVGEGSVIASNSVVTHDVPSNSLAAGIPAKVIKQDITWRG